MVNLDDVKRLLTQGDDHTLSLYLDVDRGRQENQSAQPAWRIYLKDAINAAEGQLKNSVDWRDVKARFDAFFDGYTPSSKGLAVFFTSGDEQIYELPVPVASRWSFGRPLVVPLLWAIDEYEPYLVVMVDQEKAELITAYLGNSTVGNRLESDLEAYDFGTQMLVSAPMPVVEGARGLTQGSRGESIQNVFNEHIAQFHRDVADHLDMLVEKHPHIRIVIGGEEQSAHALRKLLPQRLTDQVVSVQSISMRLGEHQVLQEILPTAVSYEREQEMALVQQVINFARAGGRGALGPKDVGLALTMQRVETLILPWPTDDEPAATDYSARAFESGASIELVHGMAAARLKEEGGIAARLYYTI